MYRGYTMPKNSIVTVTFSNGTVLTVDYSYDFVYISFGGWEKIKMLNYTQIDTRIDTLHYFYPTLFRLLIGKCAAESILFKHGFFRITERF